MKIKVPWDSKLRLGDTVVSHHITNNLEGVKSLIMINIDILFGKGKTLKVTKIGYKLGFVVQRDEKRLPILIRNCST